MDGLTSWKNKPDKYDDEYADDDKETYSPRLVDTMNEVVFIKRDSVNKKAMKSMGIKW